MIKIKNKNVTYIFLVSFIVMSLSAIDLNLYQKTLADNNRSKEYDDIQNIIKLHSSTTQDDFLYYKNITIDHQKVSGSSILVNFPFLLDFYDSDLRNYAQTDGDDIAFFNNSVKLNHEIIKYKYNYNQTHSHLITYIKIPNLSPLNDMIIQMYFGNPTIESQENSSGVWSSDYAGVWHLEEDPNEQIKDSTKYGNHGDANNMDSNDITPSIVGNGLNFSGYQEHINCGNDVSLDLNIHNITIGFWINPNSTEYTGNVIVLEKGGQYRLTHRHSVSSGMNLMVTLGGLSFQFPQLIPNTWNHYVLSVNYGNAKSYRNGQKISDSNYNQIQYPINPTSQPLYISSPSGTGQSTLDEVRVSNVTRSPDWIKTSYDNQIDPTSFYTTGQKENSYNVDLKPYYFKFNKAITIDHDKVNGTGIHVDFPLLLDLLDKDLHDYAQPDGRDIMFYNGSEWLDYEIEYYNHSYLSTHARLVAWVRIPFLSTSKNTNITMYFGNSSIISQQNSFDVWNSNYNGVWHLKENTSDVIKDSTQYHNDGETYGTMTSDDLVEGQIDGALYLDGIDDYINVGNDPSLDFNYTDEATIEAWFLPKDNGLDQKLISKSDTGEPSYQISFSGGKVKATGGVGTLESNSTLSLDIWQHIVIVIKGGVEKLYVNGILDNINDPSYLLWSQPNNDLIFGCGWNIQPSTSNFYNGSLDEIRISNVERSAGWIATQYNNQFDPNTFYSVGALVTAPGNFSLSTNATLPDTDGIFSLNWTNSTGAENYSIYYYENWIDDYYLYLNLLDEGLTNNSRTVQFSNGTYYFVVIAYNQTGYTLSNCIEVIVKLLPGSFTVTCNASNPDTDGIFMLNWTKSNWARNYSIYYHNTSFSEIVGVSLLVEGLTNFSYLITFPRGTFYFRVVSYNEVGSNISANEVMVYNYLPPDPFELTADISSLDANGFITIIWTPSGGALNYSLYLDDEYIDSFNENLTLIDEGITENFIRIQLKDIGTYYFIVVAYNDIGNVSTTCYELPIAAFPNSNEGGNDYIPLIIIIIIIASIVGASILVISIRVKNSSKKEDIRKEIPLKNILTHIKNIFQSKSTKDEDINKNSKMNTFIEDRDIVNKDIIILKQKVIELYLEGAYLETIREINNIIKKFKKSGKQEDFEFFSNLYIRINNLIKVRDDKIILLEEAKKNNNDKEILSLYREIIQISTELNDTTSIEMYQFEMENHKNQNK